MYNPNIDLTMPGESANSIGHYLASRGGTSDISSNLTLSKPATKPSTFSSFNDTSTAAKSSAFSSVNNTSTATASSTFSSYNSTTKKSSAISNNISTSTPVAKPRSVYNEPKPDYNDLKPEPIRSSPPRSYPVAKRSSIDSSEVNLVSHPIVTVGNGGEDWGTKKRVETKTVKTIGKLFKQIHINDFSF